MAQNTLHPETLSMDGRFVVTWLGKVSRNANPQCPGEFLIRIFGSRGNWSPDSSGNPLSYPSARSFLTSVGKIPKFTVGSVWENGQKVGQMSTEHVSFAINPSESRVLQYKAKVPYGPGKDYILDYKKWAIPPEILDQSFAYLKGRTADGHCRNIIIPCSEIVRCV